MKPHAIRLFVALLLTVLSAPDAIAQNGAKWQWLEPAPEFNRKRFWATAGTGAAIYTGFAIGLYNTWYRDYPVTGFHTFDDWGEWENIDKAGHLFTAYIESELSFHGALWTGMDRRKAMWTGAGVGMLLQGTVEVMDGFSEQWGFSWYDFAFNTGGVGLFIAQEMLWQEQRIHMKVSNSLPAYSEAPIPSYNGSSSSSIAWRGEDLYGQGFFERFLKDYNGQTIWASVNIKSFLPDNQYSRFPSWLNLAFGYGAENIFGAYGNGWRNETGDGFGLDSSFNRYRQYFLSFDIDLRKIPTRNPLVRSLLGALNWIKIPSPALEWNSRGGIKGYWMYW